MYSRIEHNTLVAYYDLKTAPITFDFTDFLVAASAYALGNGYKYFDVAVVADAFRNLTPREQAYSMEEREWRLWNLIIETIKITPTVCNVSLIRRPMFASHPHTYPPNYHPETNNVTPYGKPPVTSIHDQGADVQVFQPSAYALSAAKRICNHGKRKIVTFTLRKAAYESVRDSRLTEWAKFAEVLTEMGYHVVVIPDQDDMLSDRTIFEYDWHVADVASMSLDLRLAIYNLADMNYVTNGGMASLFIYSKVPFFWYSVMVEGSHVASADYYRHQGLEVGEKYRWLGENQKMIWESDTFENLQQSIPFLP